MGERLEPVPTYLNPDKQPSDVPQLEKLNEHFNDQFPVEQTSIIVGISQTGTLYIWKSSGNPIQAELATITGNSGLGQENPDHCQSDPDVCFDNGTSVNIFGTEPLNLSQVYNELPDKYKNRFDEHGNPIFNSVQFAGAFTGDRTKNCAVSSGLCTSDKYNYTFPQVDDIIYIGSQPINSQDLYYAIDLARESLGKVSGSTLYVNTPLSESAIPEFTPSPGENSQNAPTQNVGPPPGNLTPFSLTAPSAVADYEKYPRESVGEIGSTPFFLFLIGAALITLTIITSIELRKR